MNKYKKSTDYHHFVKGKVEEPKKGFKKTKRDERRSRVDEKHISHAVANIRERRGFMKWMRLR